VTSWADGELAGRALCLEVGGDLGDEYAGDRRTENARVRLARPGMARGLPRCRPRCPAWATRAAFMPPPRNSRVPAMPAYAANWVSVAPGARQETRTPEPRTSSARAWVKDSTYALVAQ